MQFGIHFLRNAQFIESVSVGAPLHLLTARGAAPLTQWRERAPKRGRRADAVPNRVWIYRTARCVSQRGPRILFGRGVGERENCAGSMLTIFKARLKTHTHIPHSGVGRKLPREVVVDGLGTDSSSHV